MHIATWNKSIRCTIAILISTVLMLCLCYYNVSVIKLLKEGKKEQIYYSKIPKYVFEVSIDSYEIKYVWSICCIFKDRN